MGEAALPGKANSDPSRRDLRVRISEFKEVSAERAKRSGSEVFQCGCRPLITWNVDAKCCEAGLMVARKSWSDFVASRE